MKFFTLRLGRFYDHIAKSHIVEAIVTLFTSHIHINSVLIIISIFLRFFLSLSLSSHLCQITLIKNCFLIAIRSEFC